MKEKFENGEKEPVFLFFKTFEELVNWVKKELAKKGIFPFPGEIKYNLDKEGAFVRTTLEVYRVKEAEIRKFVEEFVLWYENQPEPSEHDLSIARAYGAFAKPTVRPEKVEELKEGLLEEFGIKILEMGRISRNEETGTYIIKGEFEIRIDPKDF